MHFWTPDGEEIKFDANGDLLTKFDIHYGQKTANGLFHFVHIGVIDPRAPPGNRVVHLMKENLQVSNPCACPTLSHSVSESGKSSDPALCPLMHRVAISLGPGILHMWCVKVMEKLGVSALCPVT